MATKNPIFTSVISGSPTITWEKIDCSENYLSWSASVELWFMGQGYEDHLVTPEDAIPDVDKVQWKKIDAQLCNQDMDLSTYIGRIASLKEKFLTLMTFTNGAEVQQIQTDKFFMVLTLIGLRPDLEFTLSTDGPLDSPVLASQLTLEEDVVAIGVKDNVLSAPIVISLVTLEIVAISYMDGLLTLPTIAQSYDPLLSRPDSAASSISQSITLTGSDYDAYLLYQAATSASVAQTGNVSICFTQSPSLGPWILDSGASDHIFGNKHLFSFITTTSTLPTVTLANGSQTMAKDRSTGKTIGIGRESQGLYHLTSPSSPAACISTEAPLLIHSRLGHPSLSKFQKMVPHFSTLSSLTCESCQLGKHTRVSFPKRLNNRAKSPFELVHTDVWGPCQTTSTLGFQYFVTFIDDYSRCTWLFLMKNRAELFSIFQKFFVEIQTEFNVSIQVLRSNNAREYFSTPFTSFMSQHGILHQSSCAHTPQQNGVAEPCYLINRMPSSILHDQIPHSLIFPTQRLYFLPPQVFGCTCFFHTLRLEQDKLSAKATKCIFLGYPRLQKGYCCYSPNTHRYFLSADVTFFEDSPFFLSSEYLPISEVLPLLYISPPSDVLSRPLQVYHCRHHGVAPSLSSAEVPDDSPPVPPISPTLTLSSIDHLPIALRKGNRSTCNPHPIC
ncbi:Retrovirus-related Pol polyprotein from transposon TNT 1-94 [Vitis vinifera]|uniref:Retrovirus-related Pol polyprotein from transposon TNT 1-94 n=1 Tax=Vitis vinifera TaxID=29760 RepID=A0A438GYF1_VITVI|nr:Retrovirus-related Pol polyprotein from transposon TNT 1-94 [Vitis vinifera]